MERAPRAPGGARRPRPRRGLVSAFLRDPGSGRVYRRGRLIGKGAFSRCYELTDMSTSAVFALKVVSRGAGRLRLRGKVEREVALHSRLRHRHVVALHAHFADRDHHFLVLEYCGRGSLAHVLEARRTLTEPEARYYLRGLVSGLRYLHQNSIVHRDLKLSNFFLNKSMVVKIGDLGLAAKLGPGGRCHRVVCGTPGFLAPEVVDRKGHSCQSDIWALGCVMYLVLTGSPPFGAAPLAEVFRNIREGRYPEPAHLSPPARRLIARLLAPDPAARPSLELLLQDDFFTQGFTPERLPPHSCHCPPVFGAPRLGHILSRVRRLLRDHCSAPGLCSPSQTPSPSPDSLGSEPMEWSVEASLSGTPSPGALLSQGTLRSDPAGPEGSRPQEVEAAIGLLKLCLCPEFPAQQRPAGEQTGLWVPRWVDDSAEYGFGYQLSDGSCGVLFRDGTHMALRPSGGQVSYVPSRDRLLLFSMGSVPVVLGTKLAVLRLLSAHLRQRGWQRASSPEPAQPSDPGLCLLRFLVASGILLLLFSDGTLQVSFPEERAHLVLRGSVAGEAPQLVVRPHSERRTPACQRRLGQALLLLQSL